MKSIKELVEEWGRDKVEQALVDSANMTESDARFTIAIALGEIDGDIVYVEDEE